MDELLSAYLDGQLTADELRQVESLLEEPAARQRLEQLRSVGLQLQALAAEPNRGLPTDFAKRVAALAIQRKSSDLIDRASSPVAEETLPKFRVRATGLPSNVRGAFGLALAVAATILLAVWLPKVLNSPDSNMPIAVDSSPDARVVAQVQSLAALQPSEAKDQQAVGKGDLVASGRTSSVQLTYTMVLDIEITLQAAQQQLLRSILAKHGIQIAKTVVVNDSIEAALNRMRHTVPSESLPSVSELYWVHAPVQLLDQAVLEIQTTVDQFPVCRFDLAFETPAASLSQAIAATAELTSDSSSIAIPVAIDADQLYRESPFESVAYQGTLVSAYRRQSSEIVNHDQIPVAAGQGSLLLLVRQP